MVKEDVIAVDAAGDGAICICFCLVFNFNFIFGTLYLIAWKLGLISYIIIKLTYGERGATKADALGLHVCWATSRGRDCEVLTRLKIMKVEVLLDFILNGLVWQMALVLMLGEDLTADWLTDFWFKARARPFFQGSRIKQVIVFNFIYCLIGLLQGNHLIGCHGLDNLFWTYFVIFFKILLIVNLRIMSIYVGIPYSFHKGFGSLLFWLTLIEPY